jgi:hypothetical protein
MQSTYSQPMPMSTVWMDALRLFGRLWQKLVVAMLCWLGLIVGVTALCASPLLVETVRMQSVPAAHQTAMMAHQMQSMGTWASVAYFCGVMCLFVLGGRWLLDICFRGLHNKSIKIWHSFMYVLQRMHWLLLYAIVMYVAIALGYICLMVPGIALSLMLPFGYFFIMYDQAGVFDAFGRAFKLVWGKWWHTWATMFVPMMIASSGVWVVMLLVTLLAGAAMGIGSAAGATGVGAGIGLGLPLAVMLAFMIAYLGYIYCLMSCVFQNLLAYQAQSKT